MLRHDSSRMCLRHRGLSAGAGQLTALMLTLRRERTAVDRPEFLQLPQVGVATIGWRQSSVSDICDDCSTTQ